MASGTSRMSPLKSWRVISNLINWSSSFLLTLHLLICKKVPSGLLLLLLLAFAFAPIGSVSSISTNINIVKTSDKNCQSISKLNNENCWFHGIFTKNLRSSFFQPFNHFIFFHFLGLFCNECPIIWKWRKSFELRWSLSDHTSRKLSRWIGPKDHKEQNTVLFAAKVQLVH